MLKLLMIMVLPIFAVEAPSSWFSLNAQSNKLCERKAPCVLISGKSKDSFDIMADFEMTDGKMKLKNIRIMSKNPKAMDAANYNNLDEFQLMFPGEQLYIFGSDLNGDSYNDFAIQSSLSAKQGDMFYYWIFNPKTKKFVMSDTSYEAVALFGKKLVGVNSKNKYIVGADFKIKAL